MHIQPLHLYSWMFSTKKKYQGSLSYDLTPHLIRASEGWRSLHDIPLQTKRGGASIAPSIHNPSLGGGLSAPRSGRFIPGNDPVPPAEEGGWVSGPVWTVRKFSPGLDSRTAQPVASCNTDYANPDANCSCTNTISCSTLEAWRPMTP